MTDKMKNIALSVCVMTALIMVLGCTHVINELGIYFNNIAYTRFVFGIGIATGLMILWIGQVFGYFFCEIDKMNEQEVIENLKQFVTVHKIIFAKTFLQQSLGLMFRDCIPHDFGLWFEFKKPKKVVVHTCFMRFAIDVVFFGDKQKVVRIVRNMKPWKFVKVEGVKEFLEVKGGTVI